MNSIKSRNSGDFEARLIVMVTGECVLDVVHRDWIQDEDLGKNEVQEAFFDFCESYKVRVIGKKHKSGGNCWSRVKAIG